MRAPTRSIETDVVVLGGGCSGVMAAVAAARRGAAVTLVEREGTLGGTSTGVLDTFYGFWAPGERGRRVVGGLPSEVVDRLVAAGSAFVRPNTYGAGNGVTYNPEVLRWLYDELCATAGVRVLLHTSLTDVAVDNNRPTRLVLTSGSELIDLRCAVAVDCSGDAVLAHLAGAASEGYDDVPNAQALTTTFSMAPVDQKAFAAFGRAAMLERLAQAVDGGRYQLPRREGSLHPTTAAGVEFVHMTRVVARDPRDPEALSLAEREGRAQAIEYARFLNDCVPGFELAHITWMSRRIGIRESRRVRGRYWLERADVVGGARFGDAIASGAAPIEEHANGADTRWEFLGHAYDIPYRSLQAAELDNLLVAGRCFSASHDAHASARNMAQCMAMGQAAGTAAALAVDGGVTTGALDVAQLQTALREDHAIFGADLEVAA
ncbi:MAG: FAD-dependent oxidoreductase [Actinobacteria bacterium]|nr:FAD-dependent oxidoreductase [Actinomycetota bacterium]